MPAGSPGWTSSASSTSRPPPRSPTASTRPRTRRSRSTTWAAAPSTSRSSSCAEGVFEVRSTNGDTHLGGDDFDQRIIEWLMAEFKSDQGIDLAQGPHGPAAPQGGRGEGQDRAVEHRLQTEINLPFITADASGPEAPGHDADPRQAGATWSPTSSRKTEARCSKALADAEPEARRDRRGDAGRRHDPHAGGQEAVKKCSAARSRTRASTPTRSSRSARRSRPACWAARSRMSCCST